MWRPVSGDEALAVAWCKNRPRHPPSPISRGAMNDVRALNELVAKESVFVERLVNEVSKVIVGQSYMIERILIGLLTGGRPPSHGGPRLPTNTPPRTPPPPPP